MAISEHESLICLLLAKTHRARYRQQLAKGAGKARDKFVDGLNHSLEVDDRFARKVPASTDTVEWILDELRRRGAPEACYVISTNPDLDSRAMPLAEALGEVHAMHMGTLISCIPGQLAYYEGEDPHERYVLHRRVRA